MTTRRKEFDALCYEGQISGPVETHEIQHAEAELGVQFPLEYADLLRTYGAVLADGFTIFGLPSAENNDPPLWQNVVSVTQQLREWKQVGAERPSLIAISEDGFGNYIYMDTLFYSESRMCVIGPDINKVFDVSIYNFFLDFASGNLNW